MSQIDCEWVAAVRAHAHAPLMAHDGALYRPIGDKTLVVLDALWADKRAPRPDIGELITAGRTVRFWSDPHFGHDNIRRLCARDRFTDVSEMDRVIWDEVMRASMECDLLVCLGDLAMRDPLGVQRRLKAELGDRQVTVIGNHDAKAAAGGAWAAAGAVASLSFALPRELLRGWCEEDFAEVADFVDWDGLPRQVRFGLSHWPVPPSRLPGPGWLNLHGHIHNRAAGPLRINCSVESIGYKPRELREMLTPELFCDLVRRQQGLAPPPGPNDDIPSDETLSGGPRHAR